jgi:hypothetical protein
VLVSPKNGDFTAFCGFINIGIQRKNMREKPNIEGQKSNIAKIDFHK